VVLLARLDGTAAMPDAYVAALFDDYAPRFDSHLVEALDYRAPQLLREALLEVNASPCYAQGLDLGCGTGLMAVALAGMCQRLVGVDLSAAMLEQARATRRYERLACSELLVFLRSETSASADLTIAADVFCYVPALGPVFTEVARVLEPGGSFAFTVQVHDGEGVLIGADCRVQHAVSHVVGLLEEAQFEITVQHMVSSRKDRGVPVPGALFVARRR
jgi:predicted TPR repeat methyltransferase